MFARLANRVGVRVSEVANAVESSPRVVIAIVATDEAQNIVGCLRSLNRFLYRDFGVIICENGGYDPFERDLRELAKMDDVAPAADCGDISAGQAESRRFCLGADRRPVTILRSRENRGYSGGVNACIAAAGNNWDFIWVLNPDTFPEPDALGALVRRQAQGGYGIVGSRIVFVSSGRVQLWGGLTYWPLLGRCRSLGVNKPFEATPNVEDVEARMDIVAGTSMFVSRDYIETVGVMDEDFFVYYEDTEWSLRRGNSVSDTPTIPWCAMSPVRPPAPVARGRSGRVSASIFPRETASSLRRNATRRRGRCSRLRRCCKPSSS